MFHRVFNLSTHGRYFTGRHVEDKLVVYLQHETRAHTGLREELAHFDHGELDEISGAALRGCIDGHPLGGRPHRIDARAQIGQIAATAEERCHESIVACALQRGVDITFDFREPCKILSDKDLCIRAAHTRALCEPEAADAVEDA